MGSTLKPPAGVDATVIGAVAIVVAVVRRLRVLAAHQGVVVCRPGRFERPQGLSEFLVSDQLVAAQPVRLVDGLLAVPLLDDGPEYVGYRLVERPRLTVIASPHVICVTPCESS